MKKSTAFKESDPSKDYDIIKKIGIGGFGKVFLCKKRNTGKECALKYVAPKTDKDTKIIRNEIGMMQRSECDSVIKYEEAYVFRGRLWIFMEYMDYGALTPLLEDRKGNIPEHIISYTLWKVVEGLAYLHSKHILHRDLKSDNIMISSEGDVKLGDFGYAAQLT